VISAGPYPAHALEVLHRGHKLFAGDDVSTGLGHAPQDVQYRVHRLVQSATANNGTPLAAQRSVWMADALRRLSDTDAALATLLADARAARRLGQRATHRVLAEALDDAQPAADTPLGQREAMRRMAARLHSQHRHIRLSRGHARLLAGRMRRLAYLRRRHALRTNVESPAMGIALSRVRYEKSVAPGHVRKRIADALDRIGITDSLARRNWIGGYETLIARESGGRPSVVAAEPATAPGPAQPDGHGLGYARGITQTIPATFASYHQPGTSTNIYDPVANICASINYVMHRYGVNPDGSNLIALVQQADMHRPPKGY